MNLTGTLIAGRVKKEEEIEILPTQRTARVRHDDLRPGGADPALHHRRRGTVSQRRLDVAVPVRVGSRDGDEAVSRLEAARAALV